MEIVTSVTLTLKSDLPEADAKTHKSGIIHASKQSHNDQSQQNVFMWVSDMKFIQSAVKYFVERGYDESNLSFIPFSSFENWFTTYPFIVPSLGCDDNGKIEGSVSKELYNSEQLPPPQKAAAPQPQPPAKKARSLPQSNPTDETATSVNVPALPTMETTDLITKSSQSPPDPKKRKRGGARLYKEANLTQDQRDELHIQIYKYFQWLLNKLTHLDSGPSGRKTLSKCDYSIFGIQSLVSTFECVFTSIKTRSSATPSEGQEDNDFPLLETEMEEELGKRADERLGNSEPQAYQNQAYDFDQLFQKLVEYQRVKGNCNVPSRYKDDPRLGKWVQKIRERMTDLKKKGQEFEEVGKKKLNGRMLTKERIERLEALGFEWRRNHTPPATWEERFHGMVAHYQTHGMWPRKKDGALGAWVHNQRTLYEIRDKSFMEKRFSVMDDIGFDWDPVGKRALKELHWDDGLSQLVAFKAAHGHFNVPPSLDNKHGGKFYKWVQALHSDYKLLQSGEESRMRYLTGERVCDLVDIGFPFQS